MPRNVSLRGHPTVGGVLEVDLSQHVGENGWLTGTARDAVNRVLVACPPNVAVRVDLGAATWVQPDVVLLLAELVAAAESVEIVGSDAEAVSRVVGGLRSLLERVAA